MSKKSFKQFLEIEISFNDIIDFFVESWKAIALSAIIGVLLAFGLNFLTPPKYKAVANIQVARVANADVETPGTLVEKLKMPTYFTAVSYSACELQDKFESGEVIVKNLKPTLSKVSSIISFSYVHHSPEVAKKCLEGILVDIDRDQSLLANPIIERKKNQLLALKQKLDAVDRVMKKLARSKSLDFSDSMFFLSTNFVKILIEKDIEFIDLKHQINELETALSDPHTTKIILTTPIYAPRQNMSPDIPTVLMRGLMIGLFLGLLLMFIRRSWFAYKAFNQ